jgi:hypothetical protein
MIRPDGITMTPSPPTKKNIIDAGIKAKAEEYAHKSILKSEKKKQMENKKKHDEYVALSLKWKTDVLPNWIEACRTSKAIKQLCIKGIPSSVRSKAWPLLVGNDLNITKEKYYELLEVAESELNNKNIMIENEDGSENETIFNYINRKSTSSRLRLSSAYDDSSTDENNSVKEIFADLGDTSCTKVYSSSEDITFEDSQKKSVSPMCTMDAGNTPSKLVNTMVTSESSPSDKISTNHNLDLIQYDLPRTFPTLGFFHEEGGQMNLGLKNVLHAYAVYNPNIGYVQGMSYIVAMLLLYLDEVDAFICLSNILHRRSDNDTKKSTNRNSYSHVGTDLIGFYRLKKDAIDKYVKLFNYFFEETLPLLYSYMTEAGITSEMYLLDWNLSLFSKALPLEAAARIWDVYLMEG